MASKQTLRERLKPRITVAGFTFFLSFYAFLSGFFSLYTVSQLTSITKQFSMPVERSGFLVSSAEIGTIIGAIITGHFLSRAHRPRILFFLACLNGLACAVATIPYFLDFNYDPTHGAFATGADSGFCDADRNLNQTCDPSTAGNRDNINETVYAIFICSTILAGLGGCGVWTIGVTYIDDNCEAKQSAMYQGILFFARYLSPVAALLAGAGFSALPLHLSDNGLTPYDSDWISAWWLGYFIIGVLNVLVSIPLLLFPRQLKTAMSAEETENVTDDKKSTTTKCIEMPHASENMEKEPCAKLFLELPGTLLRLISNPILMFICIGLSIELAVSVAYPTFLPMYVEVYFKVTAWTANIAAGFSAAAGRAFGVLIGGYIVAKVHVTLNKMSAVASVSAILATSLYLVMLAINCDNHPVAGLTTYGQHNFSQECNQACNCDDSDFNPICGDDGVTYTNPCHAGCIELTRGMYTNCSCIHVCQSSARPGVCGEACTGNMAVYAVILFFMTVIISAASMPVYMMIMRCTKLEDKSFALAILSVMASCGVVPLPVIFGLMIDKACVLAAGSPCNDSSSTYCLLYDNSQFRFILHIITFGSRMLPGFFYAAVCVAARHTVFAGDSQIHNFDYEPILGNSDNKMNCDNKALPRSSDTKF